MKSTYIVHVTCVNWSVYRWPNATIKTGRKLRLHSAKDVTLPFLRPTDSGHTVDRSEPMKRRNGNTPFHTLNRTNHKIHRYSLFIIYFYLFFSPLFYIKVRLPWATLHIWNCMGLPLHIIYAANVSAAHSLQLISH